jgi:hypothetical protein
MYRRRLRNLQLEHLGRLPIDQVLDIVSRKTAGRAQNHDRTGPALVGVDEISSRQRLSQVRLAHGNRTVRGVFLSLPPTIGARAGLSAIFRRLTLEAHAVVVREGDAGTLKGFLNRSNGGAASIQ